MPYSDNMYSMNDDSDGEEDCASRLSPSDGQFPTSSSNATPHVPNILVPDPTLLLSHHQETEIEREGKSKAREAEEEALLIRSHNNTTADTDFGYDPSESSSQLLRQAAATTTTTTPPHVSLPHHHYHEVTYSQSSAAQAPARTVPGRAWSPSVYSEVPPAYSPSPVSPPTASGSATATTTTTTTILNQQGRLSRNYNTFGVNRIMGAPDFEAERLLGQHQPESMGGPPDEEAGADIPPAWSRRVRRCLPGWLGWKYGLLALVVLVLSAATLGGVFSSSSPRRGGGNDGDDNTTNPALPVDGEPEGQVPGGGSESPGLLFDPPYCKGKQYRFDDQILSLDFDKSRNFTFKEDLYKQHGSTSVHVGGRVDVRRLKKGDGDPRAVLEIVTNEPGLRLYTSLDVDEQRMKVTVPESYDSTVPGQRPCIEMKGTIWVPEDAEIGILAVHTVHLGILLLDDLSIHVRDYTDLHSVVGSITAAVSEPSSSSTQVSNNNNKDGSKFTPAREFWAFDSRIIEARTTSGSIDGDWPLYDLLGLHTTSGGITVSITPKDELESDPKAAVLSLSTISGVISATEPIHEPSSATIPRRNYLVDVKSTAGSIHGALAFGAAITVHATASNLDLDLLPVVDVALLSPEKPAELETVTTSGATNVRVLEPVFFDGKSSGKALVSSSSRALDCLKATHKSTSGNVGLRYPQSWEGMLYASTTSGRLVAKGKDLKILKHAGGWPGSKMEARKGDAGTKSTIEVRALLGGMDALIGDES